MAPQGRKPDWHREKGGAQPTLDEVDRWMLGGSAHAEVLPKIIHTPEVYSGGLGLPLSEGV